MTDQNRELDALRAFVQNAPSPSFETSSRIRRDILTRIAKSAGDARPWYVRHRMAVTGAGISGVVAAAIFAVVAVGTPQAAHQPDSAAQTGSSVPIDLDVPALLNRASLSALQLPELTARPDQFVYIESFNAYPGWTDGVTATTPTPHQRQVWLSVDGTRTGLLRTSPPVLPGGLAEVELPGCADGGLLYGVECTRRPAVRTDLPTTAEAMLDWLYANPDGKNPSDVQAFAKVGATIGEAVLPPAALSAIFAAAAQIPGTTVQPGAVDVSGRPGIGVSFAGQYQLIFDPTTFAYLGECGPPVGGQPTGSAFIRSAIVDSPGQLP